MVKKSYKRVIITGAGFSAPANIPIQNKIIDKMTQTPHYDFLSGDVPHESEKFLNAYITVGLFLLNNYGCQDYQEITNTYKCLQAIDYLEKVYRQDRKNDVWDNMANYANQVFSDGILYEKHKNDYYAYLYAIRDKIRTAICNEKINVNLEDVFTSFDKTVIAKEYNHKYSYTQMDEIRYATMRLFNYYFSESVKEHSTIKLIILISLITLFASLQQ